MVSQGGHIASQGAQHPQFRGVCVEYGLDQGAHGEVACIQNQGVRVVLFCPVNESLEAGNPSQGHVLPLFHCEEAVQVGMGVVEEEDVHLPGGLCPGSAALGSRPKE